MKMYFIFTSPIMMEWHSDETFYYEKNCRLVYERLQEGAYKLGEEELQQFTRLVKHEDFESTVDFVTGIVSRLRKIRIVLFMR